MTTYNEFPHLAPWPDEWKWWEIDVLPDEFPAPTNSLPKIASEK